MSSSTLIFFKMYIVHPMIKYCTHHLCTSAGTLNRYTSKQNVHKVHVLMNPNPGPMTEAESGICVHLRAPRVTGVSARLLRTQTPEPARYGKDGQLPPFSRFIDCLASAGKKTSRQKAK